MREIGSENSSVPACHKQKTITDFYISAHFHSLIWTNLKRSLSLIQKIRIVMEFNAYPTSSLV